MTINQRLLLQLFIVPFCTWECGQLSYGLRPVYHQGSSPMLCQQPLMPPKGWFALASPHFACVAEYNFHIYLTSQDDNFRCNLNLIVSPCDSKLCGGRKFMNCQRTNILAFWRLVNLLRTRNSMVGIRSFKPPSSVPQELRLSRHSVLDTCLFCTSVNGYSLDNSWLHILIMLQSGTIRLCRNLTHRPSESQSTEQALK